MGRKEEEGSGVREQREERPQSPDVHRAGTVLGRSRGVWALALPSGTVWETRQQSNRAGQKLAVALSFYQKYLES